MLTNLEKVRKQNKVSLVDIADLLEVRYQTVSDKINGISDFKFGEALLIKNTFFPEYEIEYLFSRGEEKQKQKQPT
ncbi:XRE family transcriptional regulator [Staphylococcus agnetis]|uniref:XRE family transcriptional regulator n=1 Tax=Staphylococcus agnetis TaxID=985762 RepID=UPI0014314216|nr:XRE family transcriptional regulator [Staphylococcus agnetis]NJH79279.1 XRE family transcriptional regulator [Staphylococcus agnetis]